MSMRKRAFYGVVITLVIVLGTLLLVWESLGKANFNCASFRDRLPDSDCGFYRLSKEEKSHYIVGKIAKKYVNGDVYFIDLQTKNSNKKEITYPVAFPPNTRRIALTTLTPQSQIKPFVPIDPSQLYSPEALFKKVSVGEEYLIIIETLAQQEIALAKQKYGNLKYLNCYDHNKMFIEYLKKSNFITSVRLSLHGIRTGCYITTFNLKKSQ